MPPLALENSMSTEQKPPETELPKTEPKAEPSLLATKLATGWEQFKQGKLLSYQLMALILVIVAGIGTWVYIARGNRKAESALWTELDALQSASSLEEFAKKNPNTVQGRIATLDAARLRLGREGIDLFTAQNADVRKKAVESVELAREAFTKLADEYKDDPLIRPECLLACAKAEAVLIGMTKEGSTESRGDPKKAIEWLDKVAAAAPDTDWGKDSKKLADTLRNQNTQDQVRTLQTSVYIITAPRIPGLDPKDPRMPRDKDHGFGGFGPP